MTPQEQQIQQYRAAGMPESVIRQRFGDAAYGTATGGGNGISRPPEVTSPFQPNIAQEYNASNAGIQAYGNALAPLKTSADKFNGIGDAFGTWNDKTGQMEGGIGSYQSQATNAEGTGLADPLKSYGGIMPYDQAQYNFADSYAANAPDPYQAATFDWADQYQAPDAYNAFQYKTPEIADIQKVQPISDQLWDTAASTERERIGQQFKDTEAKMKQAAIQTQARPEQMAALLANQGVEQTKAQTAAQNQIDMQRAQQGVGIAQAEQGLQATRGSQQAQLEAANQEAQAQEMATKYGLDVDAARYMVSQQQSQQTAQALELQQKYGLDAASAKELAAQQSSQQTLQGAQKQYGQEWAKGERATAMGLEQAQREAQAGEYEKAYQSKYGLAQDQAQTQFAKAQAQNAANLDYANAMLQKQQAQSQQAAQGMTYQTNLTADERKQQGKDAAATKAYNESQAQKGVTPAESVSKSVVAPSYTNKASVTKPAVTK